jgi:hypothetical protein
LPHDEREAEYARALAESDWQVKAIKLADLYDNLGDSRGLSTAQQRMTVQKSHCYLEAIWQGLPANAENAFRLVKERLAEIESGLTT